MPYKDKEQAKQYAKERQRRVRSDKIREIERLSYRRNVEKRKAKSTRFCRLAKEYVISQKEGKGCADCGNTFPTHCLDFDHLPQHKKRFSLGNPGSRGKELIDLEIAKCEIVCANCHSTRTKQRHNRISKLSKKELFVLSLKDKPCVDCGREHLIEQMQFDHLRDKKFNISVPAGYSIEEIKKESEKCDVVCANCHRNRTFGAVGS